MTTRRNYMPPGPQGARSDRYHHWWTCAEDGCGKRAYGDKQSAKRALKTHIDRARLRTYKCGDGWHIGHLADPVIAGEADRHDIYGSAA